MQVSLSLKLIVQVNLALRYGTLFSSVVPTYVISQSTSVKKTEKLHQLPTPFQVKIWILFSNAWKVVWHIRLNVHTENSGVFSVCYKIFLSVLKVVTNSNYFSNMIFPLKFIKVCLIPIQKTSTVDGSRSREIPEYSLFDTIGDLSIKSFWYHSKWYQENPWVMLCSHTPIKRNPWVMLC